MNALLLDFGATHTKAGLFDGSVIKHVLTFPSVKNDASELGFFELLPQELRDQFEFICRQYWDLGGFDRIVLCSQMHGFLLLDEQDRLLTPYFGWQDERATRGGDSSVMSWLQVQMASWFLSETGMRLRSGLPVVTLAHLLREKVISRPGYRVFSIPDWLAFSFGEGTFVTHATLQMGMGFHAFSSGEVSSKVLQCLDTISPCSLRFNRCEEPHAVAGYWPHFGQKIPIHIAGGDLQCALYGANISPNDISINIGTGSQISRLNWRGSDSDLEYRPFYNGDFLATRTHIPAGRALAVYMGFLSDVVYQATGQRVDLWSFLGKITFSDLDQAALAVDLNVFQAACGFKSGGQISHILESQFDLNSFLSGVLKGLLDQYLRFFSGFCVQLPDNVDLQDLSSFSTLSDVIFSRPQLLLSGGVSQRVPVIQDYFKKQLSEFISDVVLREQDTLVGLSLLCR